MFKRTIHQYCNDSQYNFALGNAKEGMTDRLFRLFVKDLINNYAKPLDGTFYLSVNQLPELEKKEYLKQWMFWGKDDGSIDDWAEIVAKPEIYPHYFTEYKSSLQYWVDFYSDDVYQEVQEGFGMCSVIDMQTGERLWRIQ